MASGFFYILGDTTTDASSSIAGSSVVFDANGGGNPSNYHLRSAAGSNTLAGGEVATLERAFNSGFIYLDGDPTPLEIGDLPVGFEITDAQICITTRGGATPGGSFKITDVSFDGLPFTDTTEVAWSNDGSALKELRTFDFPGPFIEAAYIGLNNFSARFQCINPASGVGSTDFSIPAESAVDNEIPTLIPSEWTNAVNNNGLLAIFGHWTTEEFKFYITTAEDEVLGTKFRRETITPFDPQTETPPEDATVYDAEPTPVWWNFQPPYIEDGIFYIYQFTSPGSGWVAGGTPPHYGWWDGGSEAFRGQAIVITNGVPKHPRTFEEIVSFATGSAAPFGGHPGPGVAWRTRMVYARGGYSVGTDYPAIGIFDGLSDRELCKLPPTSTGGVPKAIMSMLVVGDLIYLTTLDSGTTAADFAGRVFSLDVNSAKLETVGAAFTAGEIPYALAFHGSRLWVGTNQGDSTQSGKVYWFRPGIDTAWTEDHNVSSETQAGVTCMANFQGSLYVGCAAPSGTAAKVLKRLPDGTWSTSFTGPATAAHNAILAMDVWPFQTSYWGEPKLYASYWNDGAPDTSLIKSFDGSSWTTVYTGTGDTLIPFIVVKNINEILYIVGGGFDRALQLLLTFNGTSWSNVTEFLPPGDETPTNILVEILR